MISSHVGGRVRVGVPHGLVLAGGVVRRCACLSCCGSCPRSPGWVVVQNASGLRPVRKGRRGGGPKCVSVWRFWPDPGDFGQTQTHFGPGARKDPGSARDSDAFWTTRPPGDRIVGTPTGCSARPPSHRAPGAAGRPTARPFPPAGTLSGCVCGSGKRAAPGGALRRGFPSGGASPGAPDPYTEKGPGLVGVDEARAFGASAPPTRSPERRSRRTPGRSRPASSPAPRGRDRWRRRRTAGPCRPCAAPGNPSSSPRPSCPG